MLYLYSRAYHFANNVKDSAFGLIIGSFNIKFPLQYLCKTLTQGRRDRVRGAVKNTPPPLLRFPTRDDWLILLTLNRKHCLSVAEWLGLGLKGFICKSKNTDLSRKTKMYATYSGSGTPSGPPGHGNLYRFPRPLVSTGVTTCSEAHALSRHCAIRCCTLE